MKTISMKDAMTNLRVECNADGYKLHSPAGIAYYDQHGVRGRVEGIPEYFPVTLSVHADTSGVVQNEYVIKVENSSVRAGFSVVDKLHISAASVIKGAIHAAKLSTAEAEWKADVANRVLILQNANEALIAQVDSLKAEVNSLRR